MRSVLFTVVITLFAPSSFAQDVPAEYQAVLTSLGRTGDFKAGVLKVNIPRNDVAVTVANVKTPTPFGFGGWIAMTKGTGGMEVMMGDLVLLQEEANPVMSALLDNGLDVTALHNHFFWDNPRIYYMHVHGHGSAADLARKVKPALDLIGKRPGAAKTSASAPAAFAPATSSPAATAGKIDTARIAQIVGHPGDQTGEVYKITIGRDDLTLTEIGAPINARMGLNTWAAFVGTSDNAAIAGDVAMLAKEVTPVLKALRSNGLEVVAIHHHMTDTQPAVFFLHYWGTGPAEKLAAGFKGALDQLGKEPPLPRRAPGLAIEEREILRREAAAPAPLDLRVADLPQALVVLIHADGIGVPLVVRIAERAGRRDDDRPREHQRRREAQRRAARRDARGSRGGRRHERGQQVEQVAWSERVPAPPHSERRIDDELDRSGKERRHEQPSVRPSQLRAKNDEDDGRKDDEPAAGTEEQPERAGARPLPRAALSMNLAAHPFELRHHPEWMSEPLDVEPREHGEREKERHRARNPLAHRRADVDPDRERHDERSDLGTRAQCPAEQRTHRDRSADARPRRTARPDRDRRHRAPDHRGVLPQGLAGDWPHAGAERKPEGDGHRQRRTAEPPRDHEGECRGETR